MQPAPVTFVDLVDLGAPITRVVIYITTLVTFIPHVDDLICCTVDCCLIARFGC